MTEINSGLITLKPGEFLLVVPDALIREIYHNSGQERCAKPRALWMPV